MTSDRIRVFVDALPLHPGLRVLEIGCGPGVAARLATERIAPGFLLAVDRSARATGQARRGSAGQITAGLMDVRTIAAEDFVLAEGEAPFDLAFAMRVGALDGRHPNTGQLALRRIAAALTPRGRLFIDGGDPLREITLPR
jgi:SAM-dependent methyltransferase